MGKHLEEKLLIAVNKKSLFYKIKTFFFKIFRVKESSEIEQQIEDVKINENQSSNIQKDNFIESIRNIENEEIKLIKLQQQYDNGLIETKDLPKDKIKSLINLYKNQNSELSKSNETRKEKLLLYRKKLQAN